MGEGTAHHQVLYSGCGCGKMVTKWEPVDRESPPSLLCPRCGGRMSCRSDVVGGLSAREPPRVEDPRVEPSPTARKSRWDSVNEGRRKRRAAGLRFDSQAEEDYAAQVLEPRRLAGEIAEWRHHAISLDLGEHGWCRPDYVVFPNMPPPLSPTLSWKPEIVEVKGRAGTLLDEKGKTKFLLAREKWPCFRWRMVQRVKEGWRDVEL